MTLLIVGIIVFLGLHLLPTVSGLRDRSFWSGPSAPDRHLAAAAIRK